MHIASSQPSRDLSSGTSGALSVGYVLAAFPVLSETFVSNEIRAMRALGHQITPIALSAHQGDYQPDDESFRSETVTLSAVPLQAAMRIAIAALPQPGRIGAALRFARAQKGLPVRSLMYAGARVAAVARARGCTHLHAHFAHASAATAIVAARLAGLTVSFIAHGYDVYGTPADIPAKLAATDIALATCEDMAEDFRRWAPSARVAVVRCGVDPTRFSRPAGPLVRNGRLLAIGRLCEQKGYEILLAALAILPAERRPVIDIVGSGPLAGPLARMANDLGVAQCVDFLGIRTSDWIAEHGPAYLGFVAPYRICANGDRDTSPTVLKEAMAMELPIVASSVMGMKEIVCPAAGRQIPPANAEALAEALDWLQQMPEAERRMRGAAGRAHIETEFSLRAEAEGLSAVIRSLQGDPPS
jgi:glycosyltransferase involved in cell wall biosynthesis